MGRLVGLVGNAVVAVAYLSIATVIARSLVRTGQIRSNPLAAATAAIFVGPGAGLGLSVVRSLAAAQGGRAWYEPGRSGAVFAFTLPAAPLARSGLAQEELAQEELPAGALDALGAAR